MLSIVNRLFLNPNMKHNDFIFKLATVWKFLTFSLYFAFKFGENLQRNNIVLFLCYKRWNKEKRRRLGERQNSRLQRHAHSFFPA
jgi:hypothetical protein